MFKQSYKQMIDTRKKIINNDIVKHVFSIEKKIETSRKLIVKRLFSVKRDSKINTQIFIIVVTKLTVINTSIVKLFSNEFNHVQHSRSLNKIKRSLKNMFKSVIAKASINEFLI